MASSQFYLRPESCRVHGVVTLTCLLLLACANGVGAQPATVDGAERASETPRPILPEFWAPSPPPASRGLLPLLTIPTDASDDRSWAPSAQEPRSTSERRACEGCPRRSVGRALLQTTLINVVYEAANLIRGQVTARITPKTWWDNMKQGWVWDLDDFEVNQIGHPYQGSNYRVRARQRTEFLRVGGADSLRQRHLGVLRRDQQTVGERFHQHDARRDRAR